jgi:hypothetical protein
MEAAPLNPEIDGQITRRNWLIAMQLQIPKDAFQHSCFAHYSLTLMPASGRAAAHCELKWDFSESPLGLDRFMTARFNSDRTLHRPIRISIK